jgi:hypothetical protein
VPTKPAGQIGGEGSRSGARCLRAPVLAERRRSGEQADAGRARQGYNRPASGFWHQQAPGSASGKKLADGTPYVIETRQQSSSQVR